MKKTFSTFVFILFFANSLYAQTLETSASTTDLAPKTPWGLTVSLNFLRFNGSYGFGVSHALFEKVSSELSYTHTNYFLEDFSGGIRNFTTTANAYGLRLNYFPFSDVNNGGFFTSASVAKVSLNTEIDIQGFLGNGDLKDEIEENHIARQVIIGYHFMPKVKSDGIKTSSRIGAGYGNGTNYGIRQGLKEHMINDEMFLDTAFVFFY